MSAGIIERDAAAGRALPSPPIPELTLPQFVLAAARQRGTKRALIDAATGHELSYAELAEAVRETGAGLSARGVRPGDVLALCAPNCIEFAVAFYAATSIGAIVTAVNPLCTPDEISRQLRQTGTRWLVATSGLVEQKLRAVMAETAIVETFVIGGPAAGTIPFGALRAGAPAPAAAVSAADVALLPTSSGTTGLPKSVVLTHRNLVASLCQTRLGQPVAEGDVWIAALPLFHIYGLQITLNLPLLAGATVVILPRFELGAFLRAIQDHGITTAAVVPPMILGLANADAVDDYDLSTLRLILSAAAPLGADLARACARRLGCRVKQAYGMTEVSGGTHIAPDTGPDRPDSVGPALPGVECRIVDPRTGADLRPGEPGELLVRTPGAMRGYLGDPGASAATIDPGGWVHTGDIVTADSGGWFYVTDRVKELIKYKGYQVAPAELEAVLLTHPAVADAAVVRRPDELAGEIPKAFVVLRAPASAQELMAWVAGRVAGYKRVRQVEFIDSIPKSPAGKVLRRLLVERDAGADGRAGSGGGGHDH
ncbi:MAG TPA: AMP-binding protein [Streptosporangiaceae bacterium]|jgi:acyl-CoA synthetase (AMP-forming)/AMP-acid ligase II